MVRQARERLRAHHVRRARHDELNHFGGEQPALAHRVAQAQNLACVFGQLIDVRWRVEARRCGERVVDRLAELRDGRQSDFAAERALGGTAQRVFLENAARDAEQEELDETRHNGLAALALDHVDDLVVRRGVELHQNLAHHADAWLGALALQRQRVEVFHDLLHRALEF